MGPLVSLVIVAGLVGLAVVVARGGLSGARFSVRVRGEGEHGVQVRGTVPGYAVGEVAAFIAELALPVGARIWGVPEGDRVALRFSPAVPEHLRQRLRNFFYVKQ